MKPKAALHLFLALAGSSLLAISSASAQSTYIWANSNVTGTPPANLDWFTGGPNGQGTWTGGDPVSSNQNTIQFFQDSSTQLPNTAAPSTQGVNLNNGGTAFQLGTLTLAGRGSATTNANLTMNLSGDALNFSAATGTINLTAINSTRTVTYNVNNNIQLGTASSASNLTITGNGDNGTGFNFGGSISELQTGGGSKLIKSGNSTATITGAVTVSGGVEVNAGSLILSGSSNAITGGFTLNGGALRYTDATTVNGSNINVNGTASFLQHSGSSSTDASITLNTGSNLNLGAQASTQTITGAVTGAGSLTVNRAGGASSTINLNNTANTFTGDITFFNIGSTLTLNVNSLADSVGAGNIRYTGTNFAGGIASYLFNLGSGAVAPLTLNNRRVEFTSTNTVGGVIGNNSSQAFTINTDLLVSSTSNPILYLRGTGSGLSSFNGDIGNGSATSVALTKSESGTWLLSGNNTYTGGTSFTGGTLLITKTQAMPATGTFAMATGTTLGVNVGGTGEFSDATSGAGSLGGLLAGTGGKGGSVTYAGTITLGLDTSNASGGNFTYAGDIATVGTTLNLRKIGTNTLTLSGNNSFNGTLTVAGGTLSTATVNNASTAGPLGNSANAVVLGSAGGNTGTLLYTGGTGSSNKTFTAATGGTGAINVQEAATNLTLGGAIGGSGNITKQGAGTLTLSANATYTGTTTISGGVLQLGNGGATGALSSSSTIVNNASLVINHTSTQTLGAISGTGSVTMSGTNTLTLSNSNTFSGGFIMNSGSIVPAAGTYNGFGTGLLTINATAGDTFQLPTASAAVIPNDMEWNTTLRVRRQGTGGTGLVTFDGDLVLKANSGIFQTQTTFNANATFNGNISEDTPGRTFTFSGSGAGTNSLTLNGQNTFTGNLSNSNTGGSITIGGSGYLGGGNYTGNITAVSSITYSSSADQILGGNISGTTLVKNTSADSTLTLSGTNTFSSTTTVTAGTLLATKAVSLSGYTTANRIIFNGGTVGVRMGDGTTGWTTAQVNTLLTNATKTSGALGIDTTNGNLTQWTAFTTTNLGANLGLTKLGTNTLTLDQTNTYTGATTVSAGTLYVTGSLVDSQVIVKANGTIGSSGGAGSRSLGNGLTIEAGGNLDLTGATIGSNSTDILSLTGGSLTLGNLTFQDLVGWDWANAAPGTYELIDGTFSIDWGSTTYLDADSAYDFGNGNKGYFTGGSLNAVIVAIPEPGAALLGGLGLLLILRRRR